DWDVTEGDLDACRTGIDPIVSAGRLLALLMQFPASVHGTGEMRAYPYWLLAQWTGYPLAVELRHRSWSDDAVGTCALLYRHHAAWVHIDEPKFGGSIRQALHGTTSRLVSTLTRSARPSAGTCYIRLHGRNA